MECLCKIHIRVYYIKYNIGSDIKYIKCSLAPFAVYNEHCTSKKLNFKAAREKHYEKNSTKFIEYNFISYKK